MSLPFFRSALLAIVLAGAPLAAQTGRATWATAVSKNFTEPAWWDQGVVFVGNWEPLVFRVRHGGALPVDPARSYRSEHTEETVLRLKNAGVNMIITHFYKTGLDSDREDIELTKQLAALCHKHGMKIGTYIGGTMFAETLLRDVPEAREWVRRDEHGDAIRYGEQTYRYRPDFNHPGYVEHMKKVVRVAIEEIKTDLIHLDNHALIAPPWTGATPEINRRFREFLRKKYNAAQLKERLGFADVSAVTVPSWHGLSRPAGISPITDPVMQEWVDFRCQDLAEYYGKVADYARKLNPNVVMELNPHGIYGVNRAFLHGVDHARLVPHGSVFWSEEPNEAQVDAQGNLVSKIRSLKLARTLDETLFIYTGAQRGNSRLLMAESMAFNRNCLGDVGGPLTEFPEEALRYMRFYHDNNRHYAATKVVADVAVLRSFPSMAYNSVSPHVQTTLIEQLLIQYKIPFEYVFDGNLGNLAQYRAVILAGQESLSDRAVEQLRAYAKSGGGLLITGNSGMYNEWRRRRDENPFAGLPHIEAVESADRIPANIAAAGFGKQFWKPPKNAAEILAALRTVARAPFSVEFESAPLTTVMEMTDKRDASERILHWVNYEPGSRVNATAVTVAVPKGRRIAGIELLTPDGDGAENVHFTLEGGRVRFTLSALEVYNVAVLRLAQ